jgi:tetratricopeptide (TPR) repeat protein
LLQIGKVGEAIAWTIRARDLEPNNVDHVDRLAYLYAIIGDFDTALELEPEASLGILLRMRNYQALIDDAEYLMLDQPHDILVRYLLAFGHTAIGNYEDALRILDTTGQPGIVLNNAVRSSADVEAYYILVNAMHASGDLESARRLADRIRDPDIPGAIDWWYNFHESCGLAILGREDEAIDFLVKIEDSPQVPWESYLRDSVCMKLLEDTPEYQQVLDNVVSRKRTLRENLPQTLENFGVGL